MTIQQFSRDQWVDFSAPTAAAAAGRVKRKRRRRKKKRKKEVQEEQMIEWIFCFGARLSRLPPPWASSLIRLWAQLVPPVSADANPVSSPAPPCGLIEFWPPALINETLFCSVLSVDSWLTGLECLREKLPVRSPKATEASANQARERVVADACTTVWKWHN